MYRSRVERTIFPMNFALIFRKFSVSPSPQILRQLMAEGVPVSSTPSTTASSSSAAAPPTHSGKTGNILDLGEGEGEGEGPANGQQQAEETEPQEVRMLVLLAYMS